MLDRHLPFVLFEMPEMPAGGGGDELSITVPDAVAPVAEEPTAPVTAGDAPDAPTAPEAPAAAPATFTMEQLEAELEARMAPIAEYMPILEMLQAAANDPSAFGDQPDNGDITVGLDPLDENFGAQLEQRLAARDEKLLGAMQQMLQPITGKFEQDALSEGDERAMDIIADDIAQNGEVTDESKKLARQISELFFPEFAARYGNRGPGASRAADAALRKATSTVRQIEQAAGARAVEQYKNQLQTLGNAPTEPGAPAAAVVAMPTGGDEMSVARRYAGHATQ
jgi:hypothetical protein